MANTKKTSAEILAEKYAKSSPKESIVQKYYKELTNERPEDFKKLVNYAEQKIQAKEKANESAVESGVAGLLRPASPNIPQQSNARSIVAEESGDKRSFTADMSDKYATAQNFQFVTVDKAKAKADKESDPSYGTVDYYRKRLETVSKELEKIGKDFDEFDANTLQYASAHYDEIQKKFDNGEYKEGTPLYTFADKKKKQSAYVNELEFLTRAVDSVSGSGIERDTDGNVVKVDAEKGRRIAEKQVESYGKLSKAALTDALLSGDIDWSYNPFSKDSAVLKQPELYKTAEMKEGLALDKKRAYSYYDKNKWNRYLNNPLGVVAGNVRLGDIGERIGQTGYTSYLLGTDDIEAAEVYQHLQETISKNNYETFKKEGGLKDAVASISQYLPQLKNQSIRQVPGMLLGGAVGMMTGSVKGIEYGARAGGTLASAKYMYETTAGHAFVNLLQNSDLSVDEVKTLATDEALASSMIEFGLEMAASILIGSLGKGGNALKKIVASQPNKLYKMSEAISYSLTKLGFSKKAQTAIKKIAVRGAKTAFDAAGEYWEEYTQEGISILSQRYATNGTDASPWQLVLGSFDTSNFSDDERARMNEAGTAGLVIGLAGGTMNQFIYEGIPAIVNKTDSYSVGKAAYGRTNGNLEIYIDMAMSTESGTLAHELASEIKDSMNKGKKPSFVKLGDMIKYTALENPNGIEIANFIADIQAEYEKESVQNDAQEEVQSREAVDEATVTEYLRNNGSGIIESAENYIAEATGNENAELNVLRETMEVLLNSEYKTPDSLAETVATAYGKAVGVDRRTQNALVDYAKTGAIPDAFSQDSAFVSHAQKMAAVLSKTENSIKELRGEFYKQQSENSGSEKTVANSTEGGIIKSEENSGGEIYGTEGIQTGRDKGNSENRGRPQTVNDGRTTGEVSAEQEQTADSRRGSEERSSEEGVGGQDDADVRGSSRRRRLKQGDIEYAYTEADESELSSVDKELISQIEEWGYKAVAMYDGTANGTAIDGFNTSDRIIAFDITESEPNKRLTVAHERAHGIKRGNKKAFRKIAKAIYKTFGKAELRKILEQYSDDYANVYGAEEIGSMEFDEVMLLDSFEELVCDICGLINSNSSFFGGKNIAALKKSVNEYLRSETDSQSGGGKTRKKKVWYPNLPREQLEFLYKIIKKDAKTSTKQIGDDTNYLVTRLDGEKVLAIYSTENIEEPTLLYEVKGKQADVEEKILDEILELRENVKNSNGESGATRRVLVRDWTDHISSFKGNTGLGGAGAGGGNARILPTQSSSNTSADFINVVKDLLENEKTDQRRILTSKQEDIKTSVKNRGKQMYEFPSYKESSGSNANEIATRWAKQDSVDEYATRIVFFYGNPYIVEKNSNSNMGYRIVEKLTKKEYDRWYKKNRNQEASYEKDNGGEPRGKTFGRTGSSNQSYDSNGRIEHGADGDINGHGRETGSIGEIRGEQDGRGHPNNKRNTADERGVEDRENVKASVKTRITSETKKKDAEYLELAKDPVKNKHDAEQSGVMWALEDGILTEKEIALFYEKISEMRNQKYKNHRITKEGYYVFEVENKNVYTDGEYLQPQIDMVVNFNIDDGNTLNEMREYLYDSTQSGFSYEDAISIINVMLGKEIVTRRNRKDSSTIRQADTQSEGGRKISKATDDRSGEDVKFSVKNRKDVKLLPTEVERKSPYDTKVYYNPNGLKLTGKERYMVESAISTDYYSKLKTHEGLQCQSVVGTEEHYLYVYRDFEFGEYQILAKVSYQNEDIALGIMEVIDSGEIDEITDLVNEMLEIGGVRQGGYSVYNANVKKRISSRGNGMVSERTQNPHTGRPDANSGRTTKNGRRNGRNLVNKEKSKFSVKNRKSFDDLYQELLDTYGVAPKGEHPVRLVDVPNMANDRQFVSLFARTMMEADVTPSKYVGEFKKQIANGTMAHEIVTDKSAEKNAINRIKEQGFTNSLEDWDRIVQNGEINKNNLAFGQVLYNQCCTNKDSKNAMKIASDLVALFTTVGQSLQCARMLKKMTPDGQLYYIEKVVQRIDNENSDLKKRKSERDKLEAQTAELEDRLEKADKYLKLADEFENAEKERNQIGKEKIAFDKKIAIAEQKFGELSDEVKRLKAERDALIQKLKEAQENCRELRKQLTDAKHQPKLVQSALGRLNDKIGKLSEEKKAVAEETKKVQEEIDRKLDKVKGIEQYLKEHSLVLNSDLSNKLLQAKSQEEIDSAVDEIYTDLAEQAFNRKTWAQRVFDQWNSWRYFAMLGNTRTHIRNVVGNAVMILPLKLKNTIAAVGETVAGVERSERTRSLRKSKESVAFAKEDFKEMLAVIQGTDNAKYATTDEVQKRMRKYKSKLLENTVGKAMKKNFDFLEAEDILFMKTHYQDSLARIITARGIDVEYLKSGTKTANELLNELREIAVHDAQENTYRDANALAERISQFSRSDNNLVKGAGVLIEGVMPFKKTPLNIAKRGIEYSPYSLVKGIYQAALGVRNGKCSATQAIETLAKGLTGTAIIGLGALLYSMGMLSGGADDDDKKQKFDEMLGEQTFAFKVGDISYTIDWMAPSSMPLFVGAEIMRSAEKGGLTFRETVESLGKITEPLLQLSVLSGVSDAIKTASFNQSNALIAVGGNAIQDYFLQAFPTIGGQIARSIDDTQRRTYLDKNSQLPNGIQTAWQSIAKKVPFATYLLEPYVDNWGREVSYGEVLERTAENFVSPGYISEKDVDRVERKLYSLYEETGDNAVFPGTPSKYFTHEKKRYDLTAKQYTYFCKQVGKLRYNGIKELMSSSEYLNADNEERVSMIEKAYKSATAEAKAKVLEKYFSK